MFKRNTRKSAQKTMSCRGCKQIFIGVSGLQKHLQQSQRCRNKIKVLEEKPNEGSRTSAPRRSGSTRQSAKNVFKCKHPNCEKEFESSGLLKEHAKSHNNELKADKKESLTSAGKKSFLCSKCKSEFTSSARLHAHSIQCKRNGLCLTCNICGVMFLSQNGLTQHHNKLHKVLKLPNIKKPVIKSDPKTEVFMCFLCDESRAGRREMSEHIEKCKEKQIDVKPTESKDGTSIVSYRCKLCDTFFNNFHTLRKHVKVDHAKDRFKCEKCHQQIFMLQNFENHKGICKIDWQLDVLDSSSITTESTVSDGHDSNYDATTEVTDSLSDVTLNSSDDEKSKKKNLICQFCSKHFFLQMALKQHIKRMHKEFVPQSKPIENIKDCVDALPCEACDKIFPAQIILSHLKKHHDMAFYRCRKCNCLSSTVQGVKVHIHMQHRDVSFETGFQMWNDHMPLKKPKDKKFYCRFCMLSSYDNRHQWHEHMLLFHPLKLLSCPECALKVSSEGVFVRHILKKHYNIGLKLLGSLYEQRKHEKIHPQDVSSKRQKSESCDQCDFKTWNKYELNQHKLVKHLDSLTCPRCQRNFKNLYWYSKHMSHCESSGEYRCGSCDFKCTEESVFEVHKIEKHNIRQPVVQAVLLSAKEMKKMLHNSESESDDNIEKQDEHENEKSAQNETPVEVSKNYEKKTEEIKSNIKLKRKRKKDEQNLKKPLSKKSHRILLELITTDDDTDASSTRSGKRKHKLEEGKTMRKKFSKKMESAESIGKESGNSRSKNDEELKDKIPTINSNKEHKNEVNIFVANKVIASDNQHRNEDKIENSSNEELPQVPKEDLLLMPIEKLPQVPKEDLPQVPNEYLLPAPIEDVPQSPIEDVPQLPIEELPHASNKEQPEAKVSGTVVDNWIISGIVGSKPVLQKQANTGRSKMLAQNKDRANIFSLFSGSEETWDSSDAELNCEICGHSFQKLNHLNNHKRFKHTEVYLKEKRTKALSSDLSNSASKKEELINLTKNKTSVFSKKPVSKFHCFKCDKSFFNYRGLAVHKGHMHNRVNPDKETQKQLMKTNLTLSAATLTIKKSQKVHNTAPRIRYKHACLLCSESFQFPDRLKLHKIMTHSRYECDCCEEYFDHKSAFKFHRRMHARRNYKCKVCFRIFSMKKAYIMHKKTHKNPTKPKKPNSIYERIFKTGGEFPFFCETCNLGYYWMSDLAQHSTAGVCGLVLPFRPSRSKSFTELNI